MGLDFAMIAWVAGPVGLSVLGAGYFYAARQRHLDMSLLDTSSPDGPLNDGVHSGDPSEADTPMAPLPHDGVAMDPPSGPLRATSGEEVLAADGVVFDTADHEAAAPDASHTFFDDDGHGDDLRAVAADFALLYAPVQDDHGQPLTLEAAVAVADELTPLPAVVHELMALSTRDDVGAGDVAAVIERDQAMAGALLRLANSSFFGGTERTAELTQAVARVGHANVRELVVGLSVTQMGGTSDEVVSLRTTMLKEAACGRVIARAGADVPSGEAFLASLLKEMGQVLLLTQLGGCYSDFAAAARAANVQLHFAEQAWLGFTHADIGAALAEEWGLAPAICDAIRFHHDVPGAEEAAPWAADLIRVGMLAEIVARATSSDDYEKAGRRVSKTARSLLGMDKRAASSLFDDCGVAIFEMGAVFTG